MNGFIRMIRDVSGVSYDVSSATIINANTITSIQEGQAWKETTIDTTKLLEPSANDISGLLLDNTIILGTDLSGITIGDDNVARTAYSIALGKGADASGTGNFVYNDGNGNTLIFDSGGAGSASIIVNGTPISGGGGGGGTDTDVVVKGTAEASGVILAPIHSAEGSSQSAITDLDPTTNPLMTKGMMWINKAQDVSGWSYVASMVDAGNFTNATTSLGGKIYAANFDTNAKSWLQYDPIDNSWNTLTAPTITARSSAVCAMSGKIYVVGGFPTWNNTPPPLNNVQVYDPAIDTWSDSAPMDISRADCACAVLGNKLYVAGGLIYDAASPNSTARTNSVSVYDPIDNSWNSVAAMDVSKSAFGLVACGGKLYACGGSAAATGQWYGISGCEIYDPDTNSWSSLLESLVYPAAYFTGVALAGKIYVVGGSTNGAAQSSPGMSVVQVYDVQNPSGGWTLGSSLAEWRGRARVGVATLGNKLYAIGGRETAFGSGSTWDTAEVYDPSLVQMPQITYQGEDFYISHQRGGPKTFIIPHPEHEGKMLRHACLEAPTRGTNVYEYQFEATEDNQTTEIALPSYFKHINARARVYVSAGKGKEWSGKQGKVNDELTAVVVKTEKPGIFNVMVTGVRKDPQAVAYSASENIDMPIALKDIPKKN